MVGLDANVRHPFRFILQSRNITDHLLRQSTVELNRGSPGRGNRIDNHRLHLVPQYSLPYFSPQFELY